MLIEYYENTHKIQTTNWISFLLLSVPTVLTLQPVRPAVKLRYLLLLWKSSNPAEICFESAPHLLSHLKHIMVTMKQCT
jgi:hypothetical protein